jgi:hypothetical protein
MRRTDRRRQEAAANAIASAVQDAILEIRTLAYRREDLPENVYLETHDHQEVIRLLADVCDTLIPGLRRDLPKHKPTDALQYTWDSRSEDQRRWLRQTLADHGVTITDFVVDKYQNSK